MLTKKTIFISIIILIGVFIITVGSCTGTPDYQKEKTIRKKDEQKYCIDIYKLKPTNIPIKCQ